MIAAPLTRVYNAVADPRAHAEWLPPQGITGRFDRVVQAVEFQSDDPSFFGMMTMTWAVAEVDGGARVDITADDVPPVISAEDHIAGMTSSLTNPAAYLADPHRTC